MKKFEIEIQDQRDIKKIQRVTLVLTRLADMFEKYGEIEITVIANPKKKWWQFWK
jgi:hypothetical protein